MCGRYVSPAEAAIERFWHIGGRNPPNPFLDAGPDREESDPDAAQDRAPRFPARYNVAPGQGNPQQFIPVIRRDAHGRPELVRLQWWLLPGRSKEPVVKFTSHLARIETVKTAWSFKGPLRTQRCLIPALGWYEWQQNAQGKQPWYFSAGDGALVHFAGLWDRWVSADASRVIESCCIVTRDAVGSAAQVHERMPVVVEPSVHDAWLDRALTSADEALALLAMGADRPLAMHAVSSKVNSTRNQGPELIDRLA